MRCRRAVLAECHTVQVYYFTEWTQISGPPFYSSVSKGYTRIPLRPKSLVLLHRPTENRNFNRNTPQRPKCIQPFLPIYADNSKKTNETSLIVDVSWLSSLLETPRTDSRSRFL